MLDKNNTSWVDYMISNTINPSWSTFTVLLIALQIKWHICSQEDTIANQPNIAIRQPKLSFTHLLSDVNHGYNLFNSNKEALFLLLLNGVRV